MTHVFPTRLASVRDGSAQGRIREETGMVDWLRITARGQKPQMTQYHYPSSYTAKEGTHLDAAAAVKKAVSLPVVSGGRILTPAFADQAIADGRCALVFVARSVIADPEWPRSEERRVGEEVVSTGRTRGFTS